MFRLILILSFLLMGTILFADEWTTSSISQPIQYGGYYPNYYNYQSYNTVPPTSASYNALGMNTQNVYQNYGYNPYQYNYRNYGYNPYYTYPNTVSNIGGNTVAGTVLRNIGRNVIYSVMRGY